MLQAVAISDTPSVVRVSGNIPGEIGRALDSGAQGVIVPLIETAEEAARAASACRYPPRGTRSWGALRPALENTAYNPAVGDHQALCFAMVETVTGVENIDEIAAVPGVDVVYVGPSDLASSAGLPPQLKLADPKHRAYQRTLCPKQFQGGCTDQHLRLRGEWSCNHHVVRPGEQLIDVGEHVGAHARCHFGGRVRIDKADLAAIASSADLCDPLADAPGTDDAQPALCELLCLA